MNLNDAYLTVLRSARALAWIGNAAHEFEQELVGWEKFTGQSNSAAQKSGWVDAVHIEDRERLRQKLNDESARPVDCRIRNKEGNFRWFSVRRSPLETAGAIKQVFTFVDSHDCITSRQALRQTEERFHSFMDNSGAPAFIVDRELHFLYANRPFLQLFNVGPEIFGTRIDPVRMPPEFERQYRENINAALETGETIRRVEPYRLPDGSIGYAMVSKFVLKNQPAANLVGAIGFDITDLVHAQEALSRANAEVQSLNQNLERRVADRTAELEMANRELEAFSYSVSHDLRSPLQAISGWTYFLEQSPNLDAEARSNVAQTRIAIDRMAQLIADLLRLSKATSREISREKVQLSAIANELCDELRKSDPQRPVEFVLAAGVSVEGDTGLLKIVLENLFQNAWKFTSRQNGARIEFGADLAQRSYFVKDNGAGIPDSNRDRLFKPFGRLHAESDFTGNGIGLAIVKRIVDRHKGRIWAESVPGNGATFYFTLP